MNEWEDFAKEEIRFRKRDFLPDLWFMAANKAGRAAFARLAELYGRLAAFWMCRALRSAIRDVHFGKVVVGRYRREYRMAMLRGETDHAGDLEEFIDILERVVVAAEEIWLQEESEAKNQENRNMTEEDEHEDGDGGFWGDYGLYERPGSREAAAEADAIISEARRKLDEWAGRHEALGARDTASRESVDLALADALGPPPAAPAECEESVVAKIRKRRDAGRAKYGTTMERTDLSKRDWLVHAQEEAMDFAIYLERLIREEEDRP